MERIKLRYIISFLVGIGNTTIFLLAPLFANLFSENLQNVGIILSTFFIAAFISYYIFGRYSDVLAIRKALIVTGLFLMFITVALHYFAQDITSLILFRFLQGLADGIYTGPMIAYLIADKTYKKQVGIFYGSGSLGLAIGMFLAGPLLKNFSLNQLYLIFSVPLFAGFLIATRVKKERITKLQIPFFPIKLIKKNYTLYTSYFIRHVASHSILQFVPILLLNLGAPAIIMGLIFGINPFLQFFVMSSIPKLKMNNRNIFRIGLIISTIAFFLIAITPNYLFIIIPMALIGFAWSFLLVGSTLVLVEKNIEHATVTGLLFSTISLAVIIGPLLGGTLAGIFGLRNMIFIATSISIFAIIFEFLSKRKN